MNLSKQGDADNRIVRRDTPSTSQPIPPPSFSILKHDIHLFHSNAESKRSLVFMLVISLFPLSSTKKKRKNSLDKPALASSS
jgi:hypothetical protein